ncbi:hypothetical protein [Limimaricola cinnabarinus]|uniref:hypothetical protein n=1 Tax=Limimaricola cinnabarinus TaxID=1125964 RepID=UPI00249142E9|nr:hypothetical protein [Limimaricola cinnabarinus]
MTNFLNAELAASKASRKKRMQVEAISDQAAAARIAAIIERSTKKRVEKANNEARLLAKAINATIPDFIAALDEDALAPFFFALERLATAANRRRIASHPLRPEIVDEMHLEADEEEAAAEEAERLEQIEQQKEQDKAGEVMPREAGSAN